MKRTFTFLLLIVSLCIMATAQTQLENASFEEWEDILISETDTIREPIDWSSLKTSDNPQLSALAPVVCTRSSEAHTGAYSLELTNVKSFVIANGVATNGLMHPNISVADSYMFTDTIDDQWNTPLTARPDSIVGWFNYAPQGEDTMQIKVCLHQGFGKQPDEDFMDNWIAEAEYRSALDTEGGWVRFSTPFNYFSDSDPEYVLIVLNSGAGWQPVEGSRLLFDDLEMIYNSPQSIADQVKQPDGFVFAVDKQHLKIQGMDHNLFQTMNIHDISGKLVWSGSVTSDQVDIASAHLRSGLYLLSMTGKSAIFTQKIMLR